MEYCNLECCPITMWDIDQQKKRYNRLKPPAGPSRTAEYRVWAEIKRRKLEMCKEWESFDNFLKDMGKKPTKYHILSRLDDTKIYYKENCHWKSKIKSHNN